MNRAQKKKRLKWLNTIRKHCRPGQQRKRKMKRLLLGPEKREHTIDILSISEQQFRTYAKLLKENVRIPSGVGKTITIRR